MCNCKPNLYRLINHSMLSTHQSVENMLKFPYTNRIKLYHYTQTLIGVHGFFSNVSFNCLGDMEFSLIIVVHAIRKRTNCFKYMYHFWLSGVTQTIFQTKTSPYILFYLFFHFGKINTNWFLHEMFNLWYKLNCKSWESSTTCNYGLIIWLASMLS